MGGVLKGGPAEISAEDNLENLKRELCSAPPREVKDVCGIEPIQIHG